MGLWHGTHGTHGTYGMGRAGPTCHPGKVLGSAGDPPRIIKIPLLTSPKGDRLQPSGVSPWNPLHLPHEPPQEGGRNVPDCLECTFARWMLNGEPQPDGQAHVEFALAN